MSGRLGALLLAIGVVGCAHVERGTCEKSGEKWDVASRIKAPADAPPTSCTTRLFEAAHPPSGLGAAVPAGADPATVAFLKLNILKALHSSKRLPEVGLMAQKAVGTSVEVRQDGSFQAQDLDATKYVLDAVCAEGWATAELTPPEPPPVLVLQPGAKVTVTMSGGKGPWKLHLFHRETLLVRRTSATDSIDLTGLPPGPWLIGATGPSGAGAVEVELHEGQNPPVSVSVFKADVPEHEAE